MASIERQAGLDYEVIIADDGSDDDPEEVFRNYSGIKVKCVKLPENKGVSAARNAGLRIAKGDLIQFVDAGDIICGGKLKEQAECFERDITADIVFSDFKIVYEKYKCVEDVKFSGRQDKMFDYLLEGNMAHLNAMLFRKDCLAAENGFDEGMLQCEDWDLLIRLAAKGRNFVYLPGYKAQYIKTTGSLTQDIDLWAGQLEGMIKKQRNDVLFLERAGGRRRGFFSSLYFLAAWRSQLNRKHALFLKYCLKSFIESPVAFLNSFFKLFLKTGGMKFIH